MKKLILVLVLVVTVVLFYSNDEYRVYIDQDVTRVRNLENDTFLRVYNTKNDSRIYIVETEGYNPGIILKVELDSSEIISLELLTHNETDKYGGYAEQDFFRNRFLGIYNKEFTLVKKAKESDNQVVAITGATLTSKAILDAVNLCIENYGG